MGVVGDRGPHTIGARMATVRDIFRRPAKQGSVLMTYAGLFAAIVFAWYNAEGQRDQACLLFERDHAADVDTLVRTYDYLEDPGTYGDEVGSPVYRVVLAQLPRTEREAKVDTAPEFCDNDSITHGPMGNPEPDPVIPERPNLPELSNLPDIPEE